MTTTWLRGAARRPRYIGLGERPNRLYPYLSDLTGARERAERLVLLLPVAVLRRPAPWADADAGIEAALATMEEPRSALFLYTGFYKETLFVGPVRRRPAEDVVFWKAFRDEGAAADELRRVAALRTILPARAVAATCRSTGGPIVQSDRLVRGRRTIGDPELVACALEVGRLSLAGAGGCGSRGAPAVPLEREVVEEFARQVAPARSEASRMLAELDRCADLPLVLSHGDFTHWNVFSTTGRRVAVVDYDAVGHRPAFFDVVHLLTQAAAEKDSAPRVDVLRSLFDRERRGGADVDLAACLFWDAYETMRQFVEHPRNRHATAPTVWSKLSAWRLCRE